jgi:hypothetical protein
MEIKLIIMQEEVLKEAEACVIDAKRRLGGALQVGIFKKLFECVSCINIQEQARERE